MACVSNCGFGTIVVDCVNAPYPAQTPTCPFPNGPGTTTATCTSFPDPPSPFAYSYAANPSLYVDHGVLLTIPVIGNIPIVYIGQKVSNAITKLPTGSPTPILNQNAQNPQHTLIYWNNSGQIDHLLPPTFPSNTMHVWGLCNDYDIEQEMWTDAEFIEQGCMSTTTSHGWTPDDKIVMFFDKNTTLYYNANMAAAKVQLQYFMSTFGLTNEVYIYLVGGERWLQWPVSLVHNGTILDYLGDGQLPSYSTNSIPYQNADCIAVNRCTSNGGVAVHGPSLESVHGPGPYENIVCFTFISDSGNGIYWGYPYQENTGPDCAVMDDFQDAWVAAGWTYHPSFVNGQAQSAMGYNKSCCMNTDYSGLAPDLYRPAGYPGPTLPSGQVATHTGYPYSMETELMEGWPYDTHWHTGSGTVSAYRLSQGFLRALLQGLSDKVGGYLDTDYKAYLNAWKPGGADSLSDNNIRSHMFAEVFAPDWRQLGIWDISTHGAYQNDGYSPQNNTNHILRMWGGNNISANINAVLPDPFVWVQSDWIVPNWSVIHVYGDPGPWPAGADVVSLLHNPPPGAENYNTPTTLCIGNPSCSNLYDRYISPGNPNLTRPHDVDSYCRLDYWAETIIGSGSDWSLRHYDFGVSCLGLVQNVWSQNQHGEAYSRDHLPTDPTHARPVGYPMNQIDLVDPTVITNTQCAPGHWPSRFIYELWKIWQIGNGAGMAYIPPTPTPACTGACAGTVHLEISVFKDIDEDCIRDNSEPLAAYIDIMVEDPSGNITVYNTGMTGTVLIENLAVGNYIVNGRTLGLNNECTTYKANIPLYQATFNNTTGDCVYGCTNPSANNYDPAATIDDGSCQVPGCVNECAVNYDPDANINNQSCCPCLEVEYVIEPSVLSYPHTIELTVEWPNTSSNLGTSSSPPGSTLAAGIATSSFGAPNIIYQETYFYDPAVGITSSSTGALVLGTNHFHLVLDSGNLVLDPGSCELDSYCWVFRWDVKSTDPALSFDDASWTNIQMGKFQLMAFDSNSVYIYIPFEDGFVYMGNAIGGIPWPSYSDLQDPISYQNYTNFLDSYYNGNVPWHLAGSLQSFVSMQSLFHATIGWATNWFNVAISNGIDWLSMNGGVLVEQNTTGGGITVSSPVISTHGPGINDQGFNAAFSNICGNPPDGCTDPNALNYNPAAGTSYSGNAGNIATQGGIQGACVYECVEIVVEIYFTAIRVIDPTTVSQNSHGTWTYQAVCRDDDFTAGYTPPLGYYNGIPIKPLALADWAGDAKFQILDEQNNVIYESGIIPHPEDTNGSFRLRWGCYDTTTGSFMDSGAPANIADGNALSWQGAANLPTSITLSQWQNNASQQGWSTSATPQSGVSGSGFGAQTTAGLDIGFGSHHVNSDNIFYAEYHCQALVPCAEDTCYKFKRVGSWTKGWEAMGVNIMLLQKNSGGIQSSGPTGGFPNGHNVLGHYHIPAGWYKLNLSQWGNNNPALGWGLANNLWQANWSGNERECIFMANPQSQANLWSQWTFSGQYWSLWGCTTPGSNVPPGPTNPSAKLGCTNPYSDKFDLFATKSDGSCPDDRTYTEFTTVRVHVTVGAGHMLSGIFKQKKFEATNDDIGKRPYDTGTREMVSSQRDSVREFSRIIKDTNNFFEFVFKREAYGDEPDLEDGIKTNMEFGRVLESNVKAGGVYSYEIDLPYGEKVTFDIIDNFGRDLTYKIDQTGNRKKVNRGPKKL